MEGQVTTTQTDALLSPYLEAGSESEAERRLAELVADHIEPVIRRVVRSKLGSRFHAGNSAMREEDLDDLYGEALVQLLGRIKECKRQPAEKAIGDLRSYVAVVSYHACYEYLRLKYPRRHNLKNKLRYLLTHQPGLALWESEAGELLGGLAEQRRRSGGSQHSERLRRLLEAPGDVLSPGNLSPADLAAKVFEYTNHPIEIDDLVEIFARLWGVKDQVALASSAEENADVFSGMADRRPGASSEIDHRLFLKWLWEEIGRLPVRQRWALLLNLRDEQSGGGVALLPTIGVATLRQIAAALEMDVGEFARLWPELPLDDARIAGLMGVGRQQVINLRKCARERLLRRMKAVDAGKK